MTEVIDYEVVRTFDQVEIRRYPSILLATVRGQSDDSAFSILFDYISGNNRSGENMSMTAPVVSTRSGTRMGMTAPVISDESTFSFVLPLRFDLRTAPRPADARIELVSVPPRHVAVLRFSGRAHLREIMEKERELLDWLNRRAIRVKGPPFLMRYNSPFAPGFMRRNEIGAEIFDEDISGVV
ncbi:MAG: heme-binding protein [Methanomassiliicoccus sp.]|nr:heme-binding protein [Methanomassiliicoccus sp.]